MTYLFLYISQTSEKTTWHSCFYSSAKHQRQQHDIFVSIH